MPANRTRYVKRNPSATTAITGSSFAAVLIAAFHLPPEWAAFFAFLPGAVTVVVRYLLDHGGIRGVFRGIIGARPNR